MSDSDAFKRLAGHAAVEHVSSGMVVGLGHGSTAIHATRRIAELLSQGRLENIRGVPCSRAVAGEAGRLGIPLFTLDDVERVDLTIDGADEADDGLNLIKGGGGALLREKMVAQMSEREIIVADHTKLSTRLGTRFPLPIEVVDFGVATTMRWIEGQGARCSLRMAGDSLFRTDQGNVIIDADFGPIEDVGGLAARLEARAGIVEHGLFIGLADALIVAGPQGLRTLTKS
jgi:ribose 5-phosphate isomerase A